MDKGIMQSGWWGLLCMIPLFNIEIVKFHVPDVDIKIKIQK